MPESHSFIPYVVIAAQGITFPAGTLLRLDERQIAVRAHLVQVQDVEAGLVAATAPLSFKRGEAVAVAGDVPKAFLERVADAATPDRPAAETRRAAKAAAADKAGRGRGPKKGDGKLV